MGQLAQRCLHRQKVPVYCGWCGCRLFKRPGTAGAVYLGCLQDFINFNNEEYDKLYEQVQKSIDDTEQVELYKKMETILADDAANVYIQDMASEVVLRKNFGGYVFYPLYVLDMAKIYQTK